MNARASCLALLVAACSSGAAAPSTHTSDALVYPRLASYFINYHLDAHARDVMARDDLAVVDVEAGANDPAQLAALRRKSPHLDLLAYLTSEEIPRERDPNQPLAQARFDHIPPQFWLVEAGSSLVAGITATQTRLRVADPSAFSLHPPASPFYHADEPTYLLVDGEHMRLVAIDGDVLTVERGYRSTATAHAAGARVAPHVVFFGGTWMLDVAANAPAVHGRTWRDQFVDEAAALVKHGPWNGVFVDDCFEDISWLDRGRLDLNRDGRADDPRVVSRQWFAGMQVLVRRLRERLGPNAPIVANPGAQDCRARALDGILLEGWPTGMPKGWVDFSTGLDRYLTWSARGRHVTIANGYSPKIGFATIAPGQDEQARTDYQAMRFGLATALLGDGYFSFDNGVFGHYVAWWYDEYDGAGRGAHWLGHARGAAQRQGDLRWREFDHGLAVVNLGTAPATFKPPPGFAKLAGTQDPVHNDGKPVVGSIVVAPHDAYLLRRR